MDEAKLQRSLRHRNVVLFYGAGIFEDDSPFLVTEFMAKGSLREVRPVKDSARVTLGRVPFLPLFAS